MKTGLILLLIVGLFSFSSNAQQGTVSTSPVLMTPQTFAAQNPTGTASTASRVMMGIGSTVTFTPKYSGKISLWCSFRIANSTGSGAGSLGQIAYGTGTAPANGAAASGTVLGSIYSVTGASANSLNMVTIGGVVVLTPNTTYWGDLQIAATTGGTATPSQVSCSVSELL